MINRAKCKLCNKVIESHLPDEVVYCTCGTIGVMDGLAMRTYCKDNRYSEYFVRVDDLGNEIAVQYHDNPHNIEEQESSKEPGKGPARDQLIERLEANINNILERPAHVLQSFVQTEHFLDFMIDILNILKKE